jgi:glutamate-1-semialdehyde 2,1-aminomutase
VKALFEEYAGEIAAVILEPIAGNMGVVVPTQTFIQGLRDLCTENGTVLIADEVITGFRVAYGGAQETLGIEADMTCYGKIIGGGLPVGAYGGKKEIMDVVSPVGGVYQAGTLSGNPLAMYMGIKQLKLLKSRPEVYTNMEKQAIYLEEKLGLLIEKYNLKAQTVRYKGMICLFFAEGDLKDYDSVMKADTDLYAKYFKGMLERGVLLPPAQFEGMFLSAAHTMEDLDAYLKAADEVFGELVK